MYDPVMVKPMHRLQNKPTPKQTSRHQFRQLNKNLQIPSLLPTKPLSYQTSVKVLLSVKLLNGT